MDWVVALAADFLVTVVQDRGRNEVLVSALPVQVGLTGSICRRRWKRSWIDCGGCFYNNHRCGHRFWSCCWRSFHVDAVVVHLDFVVTVVLVTGLPFLWVWLVIAAAKARAGCTIIDFFLFVAAKHQVG